eukprot:9473863-Pyramimonas_sp.AAC.3
MSPHQVVTALRLVGYHLGCAFPGLSKFLVSTTVSGPARPCTMVVIRDLHTSNRDLLHRNEQKTCELAEKNATVKVRLGNRRSSMHGRHGILAPWSLHRPFSTCQPFAC